MKKITFAALLLMCLAMVSEGCSQCSCASVAVSLQVESNEGQELVADSVVATQNGKPIKVNDGDRYTIGADGGTYRLTVTVGDRTWESGDIVVEMDGDEDCLRPITQNVSVVFPTDTDAEIEAEITPASGGCGS